MAITNNGCKNLLADAQLPEGYTRPAITGFTDYQYKRTLTVNVPKATVQDADAAVTMGNILAEIEIAISDNATQDFLGTATVTTFGELVALSTNVQSLKGDSPLYTNAAINFVATVNLYVKAL